LNSRGSLDSQAPGLRHARAGVRGLALWTLLGAVALAIAAFPFRHHWWGGLLLAVAEAGVVGGLADWFAVTALFRHPLGLPIPHTALVPSNWELLARRVGTMVGDRVLTKAYVAEEIGRLDLAGLLASGAARITHEDLEALTRTVARWLVTEVTPGATGELLARIRRLLVEQPLAPLLADLLEAARGQAWHERALTAVAAAVGDALDRPAFRETMGDVIDGLLRRYREGLTARSRFWLGVASALGLVDRERLLVALQRGLREVATDPTHPLRRQIADALAELPARLRTDTRLIERVEAFKAEALASPAVGHLVEDAAAAVRQALAADLATPNSEIVGWIADRLERVRQALLADPTLRAELDAWAKARILELVEHHHGRLARFIENGVRALGAEGAVRLIEDHAGDDLQYIRVNGTVVGGLAGGAIYLVHLLLRAG
jgi:uncharacterized membrane-anchored protein YjiN (DUF445 family)